ncbi:nagb/rpia/CoA transferase-like protein [Xylariomycetidae sp. FL2044]|nr:nagb/rpia/CoA transferase-like protein [Xylariomycetidae sp. FL2044]
MSSGPAQPKKGEIKKRKVAGSFLFKLPHGDEKQAQVALFRRSGEVRTYQHKLAPISGSVEETDADPLATALREIREETSLTPPSIELLRVGKPYSFVDHSIGREWSINPFAFRLKDQAEGGRGEEGIVLDWEHERYEWYDPLDVIDDDEFGGVPKLVNSLRRVWPEYDLGRKAGRVLSEGLQDLRCDHESGARQLASKAVSTLRNVMAEMDASTLDETWWANVRMAAWHLSKARESMGAAVTAAIIRALDTIEAVRLQSSPPSMKLQHMIEAVDHQLAQRETTVRRIRDSFIDLLRGMTFKKEGITTLTLSNSSTISTCLPQAAATLGVPIDIRVLESRPLCEGVTLASNLLETTSKDPQVSVTLYSDASAAVAARGIDLIILGADRISSVGDVSNKIGSLPAVLSVKHVAPNAKVVVFSETDKIANPGSIDEHPPEENDPAQLLGAWERTAKGSEMIREAMSAEKSSHRTERNLAVKNVYFEWVPADLIDAYITEEGVWSIDDITKRSRWVGGEMTRFFEGL